MCYITFCNPNRFQGDVKHQFTYEIEVDQKVIYVNRSISKDATDKQLSIMIGLNVTVIIAPVIKLCLTLIESI